MSFIFLPLFAKSKNEAPASEKDKFYGDDWTKMDEDFEKSLKKKKLKKIKPQKKKR